MKKNLSILLLCLSMIGLDSCTKGFEELNSDPNTSISADPDQLFAYAVLKYHTDYNHGVQTEIWGINAWMQIQASINGIGSASQPYFINGEEGINSSWSLMYAEVLGNIAEAIRITQDSDSDLNRNAMYRIYQAYIFQRITDLWGDVPFSEAHDLVNEENTPTFNPSYDQQSDIYMSLIEELKASVAQLDPSQDTPQGQDWLYNGDVESWRKFGNSLILRMAMRISSVDPAMASSALENLDANNDFILSNGHSALFPHNGSARSAFYELHATGQGMYNPSKFLLDKLVHDEDPRVSLYADFSPESVIFGTNEYVGVPSFVPASEVDPNTQNDFTMSYVGSYFLDVNLPGIIMSQAETRLLIAEAAQQGWLVADPQNQYELGVRAHMEQLEVETEEIDAYLVANGAYNGTLEQIATEKWKTFIYTDPIELWSEWRRTGYPLLLDNEGQALEPSSVPVRFAYPNSELSVNQENVSAVGYGINDYSTPHWWDE